MKTRLIRFIIAVLVMHCGASARCQSPILSGVVIDYETGKPIENCNVFISQSGKGTMTDTAGKFTLMSIGGSFSLVISNAGSETIVQQLSQEQQRSPFSFRMKKKIVTMEKVVLVPAEKDGWERWGWLFTRSFLGESVVASQCVIENPQSLKFYRDAAGLKVDAADLIIISNNFLGYKIKYQLEKFFFDFKEGRLTYMGYPLFEELDPDYAFPAKYQRRRLKCYQGSAMHFLRTVYSNQLAQEGFEVRRMDRFLRVDTIFHKMPIKKKKVVNATITQPVFRLQKRFQDVINATVLTSESLIERTQHGETILTFPEFINIKYLNEREPPEFPKGKVGDRRQKFQLSNIFIANEHSRVEIRSNGSYSPPLDLVFDGYFGWERIGDSLPIEFQPRAEGK